MPYMHVFTTHLTLKIMPSFIDTGKEDTNSARRLSPLQQQAHHPMGKKGGRAAARSSAGGGGGKGGLASDDERESVTSEVSYLSSENFDTAAVDESGGSGGGGGASSASRDGTSSDFNEVLEKIGEKRGSTREQGLKELTTGLRSYAFADQAVGNRESVFQALLGLIRRAGEKEGVLCAEALGLMLLLIGPEEDEIYGQVRPVLEYVITRGQQEDVRVEAIRALALGSFICNSEEEMTLTDLHFFEEVFAGESEGEYAPDELKGAAVDSWALLATVAPRGYHTEELRVKLMEELLALLDPSSSAELKLAAGEAVALLREYWRGPLGVNYRYSDEEQDLLESLMERLQEMAREGSKRMSRKEKKEQRASFREVYAAVTEGKPPEEVINFRTRSFRLTSWAKLKQLEALRDCLQGGFLVGFARNPVIHDIFEIDASTFEAPIERSVVDKNSDLGKWRTTTRERNRRSKNDSARHPSFGEEDG